MYKKNNLQKIFIFLIFSSLYSTAFAVEPENLYFAKQAIIKYYDSGEYDQDANTAAISAKNYLKEIIAKKNKNELKKTAIIMDIDDTVINEYNFWLEHDFSWDQKYANKFHKEYFPAIKPILELYNFAKNNQIKVFFITGRFEKYRTPTIAVLNHAGYKNFDGLFMRANDDKRSAIIYKNQIRKNITDNGYDIVLSVGDQDSDLKGSYADKTIKIPNPCYYLP